MRPSVRLSYPAGDPGSVYRLNPPSEPDGRAADALLHAGIRNRDHRSMEMLYDRYSTLVYSVALRVLREPGAAEDVVQEVFLSLWRNPGLYVPDRGSLAAWLAVVARNRSIDRRRHRQPEADVTELSIRSNHDLSALAEREILLEKVRGVLQTLPAEQRNVLEMAFFDGSTHSEIASKTGDPLGTVKTRIRSALIALRKAFE